MDRNTPSPLATGDLPLSVLRVRFAVAGAAVWFAISPGRGISGPLTLSDGTTVRILGVTYGTNHVYGSAFAKTMSRFGISLVETLTTARPSLVIWLNRSVSGPSAPEGSCFRCFLADEKQVLSGQQVFFPAYYGGSCRRVNSLAFEAIPRRDREISVHFIGYDKNAELIKGGSGSLTFKNPVYGQYPEWNPETLPVTKQVGDVKVTLKGFEPALIKPSSGIERNTRCDLIISSLSDSNEVWEVVNDEFSDATGNFTRKDNPMGFTRFQPGLWPSEEAWKLRLEIKRKGFRDLELVHLDNVPLGKLNQTNAVGFRTNYNGVSFTLDSIIRRPEATNGSRSYEDWSEIRFKEIEMPDGCYLKLISATLDNGSVLKERGWTYSSESCRSYSYDIKDEDAKSVDLVIGIQKTRWVEFMVSPVSSEKQ